MTYQLHYGDALEFMANLPDASFDAVITDPPYNASRSAIDFAEKGYRAVDEAWDKNFSPLPYLEAAWRTLKPTGSLLAFCGYRLLSDYLAWRPARQILHWQKSNAFPAIAKVYAFSVEYIVWYTKGSPYTFNKSPRLRDVITTPICGGDERTPHPTQKPLALMGEHVTVHTKPGDLILDPFAGSGTTGVAALKEGRRFVGCELDPNYHALAAKRLEAAAAQPRLLAAP